MLVLGALALTASAGTVTGQALVVVNAHDSQAVLVDPLTQEVLARLPTGPDPREVALSPDGRYAYVTSYGRSGTDSEGTPFGDIEKDADATIPLDSTDVAGVTVLDLASRSVASAFYPGPYGRLHGIWVGRSGQRLWMTAEADSGIVELNARTGEVLMLWKTGSAASQNVVIGPQNRRIYVANGASGFITMIDRVTVVPRRVMTGPQPEGLALSPGGSELWVSDRGDNSVTILATHNLAQIARFPSGGIDPVRLRFHPDGLEVWVLNRGSRNITVLDVAAASLLHTIELDVEPRSIAFSANGERAFVTAPRSHQVYVIDVPTRAVLSSFRTGSAPHGLAWSTWGGARAAGSSR
jgi:DNA-binding beta-propeller fold protein YncE